MVVSLRPGGVTILGDDLHCHQPTCEALIAQEMYFIFTCKPDSHATLYEELALLVGPRKRYGDKIDYQNLPDQYLVQSCIENSIRTRIYQAPMLHKSFDGILNIVIIVKQNLQTGKQAHVILFSNDLNLPADQLIRYYSLRFQIEFNFRDAK